MAISSGFSKTTWFAMSLGMGLTILLAYAPGLDGPFVFDDFVNIVNNPDVAMQRFGIPELLGAARSDVSSTWGRPLSYISLALSHYIAGGFDSTFVFKLTNVVIHSVNSLLVLVLARLLLRQHAVRRGEIPSRREDFLAVFAALLWALHPLQLTSVLYVVQRMTSLSALFMLAGLIAFVHGRRIVAAKRNCGIAFMVSGLAGGTALGLLCKETAILLPLYALTIELTLFSRTFTGAERMGMRSSVLEAIAVVTAVAAALLLSIQLDWVMAGYQSRDFTLHQRLLTEPRVVWFYLSLLLLPGINRLTIFHDDVTVSTGLLSPWTTLPAILGIAVALFLAVMFRRHLPMAALATLWFLAGHSLESSVIALELIHEHRNYLPVFGPIIALVYGIGILTREHGRWATALSTFVAVSLAFGTYSLSHSWRSSSSLAELLVRHHPASARSNEMMASVYLTQVRNRILAMDYYRAASELAPHESTYLLKLVVTATELTPSDVEGDDCRLIRLPSGECPKILRLLRVEDSGGRKTVTLDDDLIRQLVKRLSSSPIRPGVVIAFSELEACLRLRPKECAHLERATLEWLRLAIDNTRNSIKARLQLMQLRTRMYLDRGRTADAMAQARQAYAVLPDNPAIALMYADTLVRVADYATARHILQVFSQPVQRGYEQEWEDAKQLMAQLYPHDPP